ncbi:unnamed protein product [Cladocopium goreaui]|uniref:RNase H type-1 domain-containing protein n=1 Tax=Cladocopium goreaui TaxID=2562237 RepID=A0A9P1BYQ2_9DINO|nr:unnamed protein product [Cladocopium goreaui]
MALHWEVCEATPHFPQVPRWQGLGLTMPKRRDQMERRVRFANFAEGLFEDQFEDTWNRFVLSHRDECQQVGPQLHPNGSKKSLGDTLFSLWNPSCLNTSCQWPLRQHRINDEWHNVPSQWLTQDGLPQDQVPGDDHFNLNEAPNTIQELYNTFLEHHLVEGPRLEEAIHLRTWYLHHGQVRQWNTPRIIELDGHWRHWARSIAEGWHDHVRIDEDIAFYVCRPDPPRNAPIQYEIYFDLILTQGLEMPSWAGLITVLRAGDRAARAEYSLAVSLPQFVSGFLLAQEAHQLQQCHLRGCRLWHARTEIPLSIDPVHAMSNGDTFIIEPARSSAAASSANAEPPIADVQMDYEWDDHQQADQPDQTHDGPPDEDSSSSEPPPDLQAVHIYRLGQLPIFGHLDWRSYHAALRDATQLVRAHMNHFVGFHYVHASLTGHQAGEEAIILQHIHDIAVGSLEKLVIVDVVFHSNRLHHGVPANPAATREVYKVQPLLARRHLLLMAQVDAYCTWMADTCIVEHNGNVWHHNDPQLRHIEHGTVFRIQLPPPMNSAWDIGQVVRVVHESGEILDFPEAGQLASSILDGNVDHNRLAFGTEVRNGARLVTCKGNEQVEDIDIPTTFPPGTRQPRLRPKHDGNFEWLDRLVEVFRAHAEAETIEGDPLLYVQTWYIHHRRLRKCPDPRPVRLDNAIIGWIEEFRFAWRDLLDRHEVFSIHVVRPRPPQLRLQSYACHVILVQAPLPQQAAGIITNLFEGVDRDAIQQFALSFPKRINKPLVIEELRLQPQCDTRRCTIHACGEPVHLILMTELPDGFNLCTRISDPTAQRPILPHAEPGHFEDVVFMQTGQPQQQAATGSSHSGSSTQHIVCGSFALNPDAQPFVPGALPLEAMSEFVQDLHEIWQQEAFAWEHEEKSCVFTTWLVHHPLDYKHCARPRNVRLHEWFVTWEDKIRQAWQDEMEEGSELEFHLVQPTPPQAGHNVAGHIIVIRNQIENLVTNLVTIIDRTQNANHGRVQRMAVTTREHLLLEEVLEAVGYDGACLPNDAPLNCRAWIGDERLRPRRPFPGRSGHSILIHLHHRTRPAGDELHLLQLTKILSADERLTQRPVAHISGPSDRLSDTSYAGHFPCEDEREDEIATAAVHLIRGHDDLTHLPSFVEVTSPATIDNVKSELSCFGVECKVFLFGHGDHALCLPTHWVPAHDEHHFAYIDMCPTTSSTVFMHTMLNFDKDDTLHHMRFLYSLGFEKAVIMNQVQHCPGLTEIQFMVSVGQIESDHRTPKPASAWPERQPQKPDGPMYEVPVCGTTPACLLHLGVTSDQLLAFFSHSQDHELCKIVDGLDLPEVVTVHLQQLQPIDRIDRIIIYTDGSSHSGRYHLAPERVEEQQIPDAWAFVALGEQYHEAGSTYTLLGWKAHQVRCAEDHPWHIGSRAIGPWVAEREAMLWALIWRIGLNCRTPTVFRSDSSLTIGQAEGTLGAAHYDDTFGLLRGCHQLLSAALPDDCIRLEHIYGHNNDPWNEMADHLAKLEARKGLFLPRGDFCIAPWRSLIPYLWMVFGHHDGLPQHCHEGFAIPAPKLPPPCQVTPLELRHAPLEVRFAISFATANVLSMSSRPHGHAGKVHYLREQLVSHGLNFAGFQETRGQAGASLVDHVFRLCAGSKGGQHGVELWCNLKQPYCQVQGKSQFFCKNDFVVLHADPQRLLVKVDAKWITLWVFVLHAPHSGLPTHQREAWWNDTISLLTDFNVPADQLFVCADANAAPGASDGRHVFQEGFATTSSTTFLRNFLVTFELCLPATSSIHEGPRETWMQPNGLMAHQIDFVMVPTRLAASCTFSSLLENFDLANQAEDHTATAVELRWSQISSRPLKATTFSTKPSFAREEINKSNLKVGMRALSTSTWTCDVETHTGHMNNQLHFLLHRACAITKGAPKRPYVSDAAWALRRLKLQHRKELKTARALLHRETLARIFAAWRAPSAQLLEMSFVFGSSLRCGLLKHYIGFKRFAAALQRDLAGEKARHLKETLDTFDEGTAASEIQHKLKGFLGSSNKLRQGLAPLPTLRNTNNLPCSSSTEILKPFIESFDSLHCREKLAQAHVLSAVPRQEGMELFNVEVKEGAMRFKCSNFHQRIRSLLADYALWRAPERFAQLTDEAPTFGCMLCQQRCRSRGGEGAHMCRKHGQVQQIRHYIAGTQCMACLKEYHTIGQIQQHLLRSAECQAYLLHHRLHGAVLPGIGSKDNTALAQEHDGRLPPLQASGPAKPHRGGLDFSLVDYELHDALALIIVDGQVTSDLEGLEGLLRAEILQRPISWTRCSTTLRELVDTVTAEPLGWETLPKEAVLIILQRLSMTASWPFLVDAKLPDEHYVDTLENMEQDCRDEVLQCPREGGTFVHRPCGRHQIVLHAFSGRRRPGDLQFYMEQMYDRAAEGIHLTVVSLDIITDPVMGDVTVQATQDFWFHYATCGAVAGFLCGPPCETWSRARFVQLAQSQRKSPRPVRSGEELWGLASLSLREARQVGVGNLLLCFALEMLFRLALVEASGVLEHPDTPPDESMPSIWRLPIMEWLLQMPGVSTFSFCQGLLGAPTPKPTRLLVLNMRDLMGELRRHHLCRDLPARAAIGKDEGGAWQTTKLKEYPPAMSRALASSFVKTLSARQFGETAQLEEAFVQKCVAMDIKSYGTRIGQDFAGHS